MRRTGASPQPSRVVTRWRCDQITDTTDGVRIVRLRPLYPRRHPLTAIPTGRRPTGRVTITLPETFEFSTSAEDVWTVGKDYEMRIEPR